MSAALKLTPTFYERAADDIIALMVHSTEVCERVGYEFDLRHEYMPTPAHYHAYTAIQTLRKMGHKGTLNDNSIIELAGASVTHEWISRRNAEGQKHGVLDAVLLHHLPENARIVRDNGKVKCLYEKLLTEANALQAGQEFDVTVINSMNALAMAGTNQAIGAEHADELGAEIELELESPPPQTLLTGITDIDTLTSGMGMNMLSSIISAYKMRKTTISLNMLLGVLMTNPDITAAFYSAEMNRNQIGRALIAMLSVAWLLREGLFTPESSVISGDLLQKAGNGYKQWRNYRAQAVNVGIQEFKKLSNRLQIYDKKVGNLQTMADAERLFKRNVALYGGAFHVFDYFGLLDMPGATVFEQSANRTKRFLEMSKEATVLVLAQKNEANVDREEGHSAGAKGGNDLPAACSYVWTTRYKAKETPNQCTLELKHSRYSEARAMELEMHAPSGLLFASNWIAK